MSETPASAAIARALPSMLIGLAVGDALGVPVEFASRKRLSNDPVTGMRGYGVWNQPPGTFSDDTSMALCMVDALREGFSTERMARNFVAWWQEGLWAAHGHCFDIGGATSQALSRVMAGTSPEASGGTNSYDNGNGALMRIAPIVFFVEHLPVEERLDRVRRAAAITHAHPISVVACQFFVEYLVALRGGMEKSAALTHVQRTFAGLVPPSMHAGLAALRLALAPDLAERPEDDISSGGFVIDTLEASLWCFLRTSTYAEAVLLAVNLGGDTDTTGCVTGALAGLYYGMEAIPPEWRASLARANEIEALALAACPA